MPPLAEWSRRARVLAGVAAVAVLAVAAFGARGLFTDDDVSSASSSADGHGTSTTQGSGSAGRSPSADGTKEIPVEKASGDAPVRVATEAAPVYDARPGEIPLDVALSSTDGLEDGDALQIHVTPEDKSEVFGFQAFLCRGDVKVAVDAEARPTNYGWCADKPLSASSDSLVEVAAVPPYKVADGEFRVGTGSTTFQKRDGSDATVTCDHDHPCQLVLKLQFPYGYGLRSFPLTFR